MLKQVTTYKFLGFRSSVDEASVRLQYEVHHWVFGSQHFKTTMSSQNIKNNITSDAASYPRRMSSSGHNLFLTELTGWGTLMLTFCSFWMLSCLGW
jgi:hypothetical protein